MRVLVTFGSKMGGTAGLARMIGDDLQSAGFDVVVAPARDAMALGRLGVDAVVIGGALYANRWHRDARRFVRHNVALLRRLPVWCFSSGPLDDSAARGALAPAPQVAVLMERIGALGHQTFGGRLAADARGFPAAAMARDHAGDWRDRAHVRRWADQLAQQLPTARPGPAVDHPAAAPLRLCAHGARGWAASAALMFALAHLVSPSIAVALHAVLVPLLFIAVARAYFRGRGARDPLPTAAAFAAIALALDALVADLVPDGGSRLAGTWLPLALIFVTTWATGALMSTMPWPRPAPRGPAPGAPLHA